MAVLNTRDYKEVERMLYNYFALKRQIEEHAVTRADIVHRAPAAVERGGKGTGRRTDPTAAKGLELAELDQENTNAVTWVEVIDHTIERYQGTRKGKLLQLRYFEELGEEYICSKLSIERSTYFGWRSEILTYTAMGAIERGLLSVFAISKKVQD